MNLSWAVELLLSSKTSLNHFHLNVLAVNVPEKSEKLNVVPQLLLTQRQSHQRTEVLNGLGHPPELLKYLLRFPTD